MKNHAERLKNNTKIAAQRMRQNLLNKQTDGSLKFYESLDEEGFRQLSAEYGIDKTARFIRAMEFKKAEQGGE